jgi:argininosuccinate lyase
MSGMARGKRFEGGLRPEVQQFLASAGFDWRILGDDVAGSLAHVQMLSEAGIIEPGLAEPLQQALAQVRSEWEAGQFKPDSLWEDVHMNVEGRLHQILGPEAGFLHTARSRNDQVALDMHLYLRRHEQVMADKLGELLQTLASLARRTLDVMMPGYTHLQPAQPVRMAHHWMAYAAMFQRDLERLHDARKRVDMSPLGAGALAGTPYPTDPETPRTLLGFSRLYANSIDAVSDRDYCLEYLAWASIFMVHVSRLSEELVLWSSREFGFLSLGDGYSTGSSIMPQKKNPDTAELLRGKSGRVFGHLMGLLTVMKGLPLAYNSDMQEDKEAVFDTVDTVEAVLDSLPGLLEHLTFKEERLLAQAAAHYSNATDLADRLAQTGIPFRQAHHRVGGLVRELLQAGYEGFDAVPENIWVSLAPDIPYVWLNALTPEALVEQRRQPFGTARRAVLQQIAQLEQWVSNAPSATAP